MTAQFVEIGGQTIAMLPADEYARLMDAAEMLADIAAADRAAKRLEEGEEYVPLELVKSIMDGAHPLRAWRKYRGLTIAQLAAATSTQPALLSNLENGKAQGKPAHWRAFADALNVTVDDIMPLD